MLTLNDTIPLYPSYEDLSMDLFLKCLINENTSEQASAEQVHLGKIARCRLATLPKLNFTVLQYS